MEKPIHPLTVPASIRYNQNLSASAKLVYCEIQHLIMAYGECKASNGYFASLYGKSKATASLWIKELKKNNLIEVHILYKNNTKEVDKRLITLVQR